MLSHECLYLNNAEYAISSHQELMLQNCTPQRSFPSQNIHQLHKGNRVACRAAVWSYLKVQFLLKHYPLLGNFKIFFLSIYTKTL